MDDIGRSTPQETPRAEAGGLTASSAIGARAKRVYLWAKNLREIVIVAIFYATLAPFAEPTLEVTYQLDRLYPPIAAEAFVESDSDAESTVIDGTEALSRLVNSRDILHLRMQNNSSDRIEDLDLQLDGFAVADVALRSDSSEVMAERERLARFDISDNFTVRFPEFTTIPPKAEVKMIFWGDFHTFLLRGPVRVTAATKNVTVVRRGTTSGLKFLVATNLSWFAIILAVGLLLLGLRRFR